MRMVYTHENRFIVANAKNILEAHGIAVLLKNEFSNSAIGELSPFDTWLELWLYEPAQYDEACGILKDSLSDENASEWRCECCGESNDAAFELCWKCARPQGTV